ncbi:ATP-binding cassette domain-containing protein [Candidatus Uabimicrobium sp. HlEnr_7]|uniref:ATP-binding cassette domain-containing protein n=1 Tax=Candidatus Uabimicrobium helgolandensis TaxID=3095367 RepID=UPI003557EDD5
MSDKNIINIKDLDINLLDFSQDSPRIQTILQNISTHADTEDVVLLLGPSGSGKSLLTNILLGFIKYDHPQIMVEKDRENSEFKVKLQQDADFVDMKENLYPQVLEGKIGIMFQALGLFDDLTVKENIRFAYDHSKNSNRSANNFKKWFKETTDKLGLEKFIDRYPGNLSGGQRQRVALARLLAYAPSVMILDEPTSALDPMSVKESLNLIREVHKETSSLTIIITHDYKEPPKIADRIWFIHDHTIENYCLKDKSEEEKQSILKEIEEKLHENANKISPRIVKPEEAIKRQNKAFDVKWSNMFGEIGKTLSQAKHMFLSRRIQWFMKFFKNIFHRLVTLSLPYNIIAGFFLGIVITYFTLNTNFGEIHLESGENVQVKDFMLPAFYKEMLTGLGIIMFNALIPLISCILIASRSGTAITAYLSAIHDSNTKQWDALRNFGVNPTLFFLPQVLFSFVFGCLLLSYLSFLAAACGTLLTSLVLNPLCTYYVWQQTFWANLGSFPFFTGFGMFTLKTSITGLAIGIISFYYGTRKKTNPMDTIKFLTRANICNMLSILLIFFLILCYEFGG